MAQTTGKTFTDQALAAETANAQAEAANAVTASARANAGADAAEDVAQYLPDVDGILRRAIKLPESDCIITAITRNALGVVTSYGIRWPDGAANGGTTSTIRVYRHTTGVVLARKAYYSPLDKTVVYTIPRNADGTTGGAAGVPGVTFEPGNTSLTAPPSS